MRFTIHRRSIVVAAGLFLLCGTTSYESQPVPRPGADSTPAALTYSTTSNTVSVINPGDQSSVAGSSIAALQVVAADSNPNVTALAFSASGLPSGILITASGILCGKPMRTGTYAVSVSARDSSGAVGTVTFAWTVTANTVTITQPGNQAAQAGTQLRAVQFAAQDSNPDLRAFTWQASGLPSGVYLSSTGTLAGKPIRAGNYPVTVTATDATGARASTSLSFTVTPTTISTAGPGDQTTLAGSQLTPLQVNATDSNPALTFLTWSGAGLPPGVFMSTAGALAGKPTLAGTYRPTLTVRDATGASTSVSFAWTITPTRVTAVSPGNQSSVVGTTLTPLALSAADSNPALKVFTWSGRGLPWGLYVSTSGVIVGRPTMVGTFTPTVSARDATGASVSITFTWTITST